MRPVVEDEEDESGQKIEDKEKSDPQLAAQDVIKVHILTHQNSCGSQVSKLHAAASKRS